MKFFSVSTILFLTSLFSLSTADITFGPFPTTVEIGQSYTLKWSATGNYTYNVVFVAEDPNAQGNPNAWTPVQVLDSGLHFDSMAGSFTLTVPQNVTVGSNYGLYLAIFTIPFNGQEYQYQTEYFNVSNRAVPSSTAGAIPTSTEIAGPSETSSPPASITSLTTSHTTSSTPSSTPTSVNTGQASNNSSHKSISGGAIAGIVIGAILAIALLIGAVFFFGWRKRRSSVQKHEAATRANRLAPVMQESHEMHVRTP